MIKANRELGMRMAAERGWGKRQQGCLDDLWTKESNWRHWKWNDAGSGAYGIPQSLPAKKMASAGPDWKTNPRTQIEWGLGYIEQRHKTPCQALEFWHSPQDHVPGASKNWY